MLDPAPVGARPPASTPPFMSRSMAQWLMSTVRDARVETPSAYGNVADLEWLIGTWTAEEHGRQDGVRLPLGRRQELRRALVLDDACRWTDTTSGVQTHRLESAEGHVQSWNFTSDGGHAIGVWTPRDRGWTADVRGVSGDGTPTAATNLLTKLDDNAYVWQSVNRAAGEQPLPDTDEVVLKRS